MSPLLAHIVALGAALIGLLVARQVLARRRGLFRKPSGDHVVVVRESHGARELVLQKTVEVAQTRQWCADPMRSRTAYTDGFHLCTLFAPSFERVLFLGGGGAIGPRQFAALHPQARIDVVERDPVVVEAARRFFGFAQSPRLTLHQADARAFISSQPAGEVHIVVVDLCDAFGVPREVTTAPFFQAVARSLAPAGVMCMNLLGTDAADGLVMTAFATIQRQFGSDHCHLFAIPNRPEEVPIAEGWRNWLVFATGGENRVAVEEVVRSSTRLDNAMTPLVSAAARGHIAAPVS
ncbi:MAG: fused MFS/spermidine synthase [Deltaproteobacteria bacterium]|nr:fused MFS/spermidine synthase [Deltaproteobacteria bacterium]